MADGIIENVITIKREITNKKTKTLMKDVEIKNLYIRDYWDSHGDTITMENKTFHNVKVTLKRVRWTEFNKNWEEMELYIDGKLYNGEITRVKGDDDNLQIHACVGAGQKNLSK